MTGRKAKKGFFSTKLSDDAVKKAELYDGFNVFTVRLPKTGTF